MRTCLNPACERVLLPGPEGLLRIRIGAVEYTDVGAEFLAEDGVDEFRDGELVKWLCPTCCLTYGVYLGELREDACMISDGYDVCGMSFEPAESMQSESVLLVEWGYLVESHGKGARIQFIASTDPDERGHVHFTCACEGWNLPLWQLESDDQPPGHYRVA